MDRKRILEQNPADWTEEEQLQIIEKTDNSLKPEDKALKQPPQDKDYKPNLDETTASLL